MGGQTASTKLDFLWMLYVKIAFRQDETPAAKYGGARRLDEIGLFMLKLRFVKTKPPDQNHNIGRKSIKASDSPF